MPLHRLAFIALITGLCLVFAAPGLAQDEGAAGDAAKADAAKEEEKLTLERLFPEKSFFGPRASAMSFSHDGRYGAYLYRPRVERRHGSDLWLYDTETGETRRLTMVSVMSEFQDSTRKVRDDREKKAKKNGAGTTKKDADVDASDDGVSGDWTGRITGTEDSGLPPGGITFTLSIERQDDNSVTGSMSTSMGTGDITEGRYDAASKMLECTLQARESEMEVVLKLKLSDGTCTGNVELRGLGVTMDLEGTRDVAEVGDDEEGDTEGEDGEEQDDEDERELGDIVDDKDAEDTKSPRYAGIEAYVWSPRDHRLIFVSQGDLYLWSPDSEGIERLTRTREREVGVDFLPDGSGYTYMRGGAVMKVAFDTHLIEQIDPRIGSGETFQGYRLSPDGNRLVVLTGKGESFWGGGQMINIVNYRGRFAQVRQVPRHMSDDTMPDYEWSIYLYDLDDHLTEGGTLKKVFTHKRSGPRDIMIVPEWAPDSSRIAFSVFEQSSGHLEIYEARFVEPEENEDEDGDAEDESENGDDDGDDAEDDAVTIEDARVVYRFLHNGGPNTPRMVQPKYLPDSRRLAFLTELSGFRHLHVLDPVWEQLDQLTRGRFEVYPFAQSEDRRWMFALSTKEHPSHQDVYRIDLESGDMTRLSIAEGNHESAAVSNDGRHVLAMYSDFGSPRELVAIDSGADTPEAVELTDSHAEEAHELTKFQPEYFTFQNRHGQDIYGHLFKPDDWSAEDKRPLLIYVYGGPLGTRKMTTRGAFSAPSYFFAYYMAKEHGYVTCTIDPRGASGYGGLFEKSNYEQVGKPQVEDLVDGARWFIKHMGVDADRVGLHGWSFGGFQTQMCLYTEPDVFACGIAGAGPTEWENYNSWYSTGTIGPSRKGKTDLGKFSLLPLAKNLEAKLLLVHGMEDSNVLYQDTVRVYRELLKAGKETLVELFLDPTGGHGLGGDVKTINRYRKYEEFLLRTIGTGHAKVKSEDSE